MIQLPFTEDNVMIKLRKQQWYLFRQKSNRRHKWLVFVHAFKKFPVQIYHTSTVWTPSQNTKQNGKKLWMAKGSVDVTIIPLFDFKGSIYNQFGDQAKGEKQRKVISLNDMYWDRYKVFELDENDMLKYAPELVPSFL